MTTIDWQAAWNVLWEASAFTVMVLLLVSVIAKLAIYTWRTVIDAWKKVERD